jgi:hypothetical protein
VLLNTKGNTMTDDHTHRGDDVRSVEAAERDDEGARKFDVPAGYSLVPKDQYHEKVRGASYWLIHKEREKLAGKPVAHNKTMDCKQPTEANGGWQPIATAPRDDGEFLVYNSLHGQQFVCFWDELKLRYGPDWSNVINLDRGVTHWMPLPAAPTEGE